MRRRWIHFIAVLFSFVGGSRIEAIAVYLLAPFFQTDPASTDGSLWAGVSRLMPSIAPVRISR